MSQLTHWNPFTSMAKFDAPTGLEDIFRNFGLRPAWRELDALPEIRIDVAEDDKSYKIKADVPGVKKEDIEVSVDGKQVAISARTKEKIEKKGENTLYAERKEGRFYRAFTLPLEVEGKKAEAKYETGVLTLMLPKKSNGSSHRIAVH